MVGVRHDTDLHGFDSHPRFCRYSGEKIIAKFTTDKTKEAVVRTCVNAAEQLYKDLHGAEKLAKVKENIIEMLNEKGITISEIEMDMLIEAAVAEINKQLKKESGKNDKD